MSQLFDKNTQQTPVVMVSTQELNRIIEEQVAKQVQKANTKFIETFFGQVVLACVTAVATAYVTQKVFGKNK
jgi:hypothetical protein